MFHLFPLNAFTDTSGWRISDGSIRAGLEHAFLLGRSQFLTQKETEALGLHGATVLLDGGLILMLNWLLIQLFLMN